MSRGNRIERGACANTRAGAGAPGIQPPMVEFPCTAPVADNPHFSSAFPRMHQQVD
jgi:hypothetical protein